MLPLWSQRKGRQPRASMPLLLLGVLVLCVGSVSASLPVHNSCPSPIDCAREGRRLCKPGSRHCGPCIDALEEDEEGICAQRRLHHKSKVSFVSTLDEEIDYLHSVIQKQQISKSKHAKHTAKPPAADSSQTEANRSRAEASTQKLKSSNQTSGESLHATPAAPPPAATALDDPTTEHGATGTDGRAHPVVVLRPKSNSVFIILISMFVAVGALAFVMATVCYVKMKKESHLAQKVDYPAFKGTGPPAASTTGTSMGDKTLAQSAQMYHYQHQKQQMLSVGNHKPEQKAAETEITSDEEEVGGDFTVYECPGLAPTGEMEVKNPLFDDSNLHYQGNPK